MIRSLDNFLGQQYHHYASLCAMLGLPYPNIMINRIQQHSSSLPAHQPIINQKIRHNFLGTSSIQTYKFSNFTLHFTSFLYFFVNNLRFFLIIIPTYSFFLGNFFSSTIESWGISQIVGRIGTSLHVFVEILECFDSLECLYFFIEASHYVVFE